MRILIPRVAKKGRCASAGNFRRLAVIHTLLMKRHRAAIPWWARTAVVAIAGLLALSGIGAYAVDIRDTKHNLANGTDSTGEIRRIAAEEVCIFCHTPTVAEQARHGSGSVVGRGLASPLWQGKANSGREYTLFDDIGRAAYEGVVVIGSVSVACLSCHDSAQAFGIGGGDSSAALMDHPFGVPYRGLELSEEERRRQIRAAEEGGLAVKAAQRVIGETDFQRVSRGVVNNRQVWWASASGSGAQRTKNDLPLYPRRPTGDDGPLVPFVECTSCHDPHTTNALFLRVSSRGARLCLTCHIK